MNTQHINLDVTKRPAVMPVIYLGQGDKNGTEIQAGVYDGGTALPLSGMSAKFCMRTPDGEGYYETAGTVSGNTATFQIDETYAANVAGTTDVAYVEILQGETVVCSTNRFRVVVHQNATEGVDPAQAWTNGVEEFLEDAQEQIDQAVAAAEEATEAAEAIVDYNVPLMSPTQRGGAKLGAGLQVGADEKLGVKVDGTTITVDQDGTMHGADTYALPTMSPTTKGGAKQGNGLSVEDDTLNLGPLVKHSTGVTDGSAIFGVQGEGYATQSGTPTPDSPQEIMVARGRNLLNPSVLFSDTSKFALNSDGTVTVLANDAGAWDSRPYVVLQPGTYTVSVSSGNGMQLFQVAADAGSTTVLAWHEFSGSGSYTFMISQIGYVKMRLGYNASARPFTISIQLELGTTPTPYVPYGHVGLEVTANGQTTVTPVPLPSKGFLGALPDGTKDTLTIDSAGGVGWVNASGEFALDGSSDETFIGGSSGMTFCYPNLPQDIAKYSAGDSLPNIYGNMGIQVTQSSNWHALPNAFSRVTSYQSNLYFKGSGLPDTIEDLRTWLAAHPMKFLYPLATPTTESLGYIDLPALPEGATVTIPELENVGVDYWVKGIPEVTEYGQAMQARLQGEIDEAEQAIADNAAGIASLQESTSRFKMQSNMADLTVGAAQGGTALFTFKVSSTLAYELLLTSSGIKWTKYENGQASQYWSK